MRIAFDLDGVLADLHEPFVQAAVGLFPELDARAIGTADIGASPPDADDANLSEESAMAPSRNLILTPRQSVAVWRDLASRVDFWEDLAEIEDGAIARLAALADERRWEVLFITSRPVSAGRTVQRQSQRWLEKKGFPLPSVYVVHGSRGRIAEALRLDVVIDDRPENCLDIVLESKAGAILVWRGSPGSVPGSARRLGIAVVSSVAACLDALVEAESSEGEGGLLGRLRRLFGLQTRSSAAWRR
jgi:5' nucleotidase, deoxy (Pyrimidine), cytosolic type C protein (NT5C)